jgi:MSHA biogenesis protein MshO
MKTSRTVRHAHGFTLVEAIIVIVITGIVAGMVAVFIKVPTQSYVDTAARAEMSDMADLLLRRVSRELRLALPNSILVSADRRTIQFLVTKTGGRYIDVQDDPPTTLLPLNFSDSSARSFNIAGAAPAGRQQIVPGDYIVVYNLGEDPADAYTGKNIAEVASTNGTMITLKANPFAAQNPQMPSPNFRFQVVTGAVTYQCAVPAAGTGTLKRYSSSAIPAGLPPAPPGTGALMANLVTGCEFEYTMLPNLHAALVTIRLTLRQTNGETVSLMRQVHVDNTP